MEFLNRESFGTNHKHRPGCRKQRAGRHYQVVGVKRKKWKGKSVPRPLWVCWSLVSLPSWPLHLQHENQQCPASQWSIKRHGWRVMSHSSSPVLIALPSSKPLSCVSMSKAKWRLSEANMTGSWSRLPIMGEGMFVYLNNTFPFAWRSCCLPSTLRKVLRVTQGSACHKESLYSTP